MVGLAVGEFEANRSVLKRTTEVKSECLLDLARGAAPGRKESGNVVRVVFVRKYFFEKKNFPTKKIPKKKFPKKNLSKKNIFGQNFFDAVFFFGMTLYILIRECNVWASSDIHRAAF